MSANYKRKPGKRNGKAVTDEEIPIKKCKDVEQNSIQVKKEKFDKLEKILHTETPYKKKKSNIKTEKNEKQSVRHNKSCSNGPKSLTKRSSLPVVKGEHTFEMAVGTSTKLSLKKKELAEIKSIPVSAKQKSLNKSQYFDDKSKNVKATSAKRTSATENSSKSGAALEKSAQNNPGKKAKSQKTEITIESVKVKQEVQSDSGDSDFEEVADLIEQVVDIEQQQIKKEQSDSEDTNFETVEDLPKSTAPSKTLKNKPHSAKSQTNSNRSKSRPAVKQPKSQPNIKLKETKNKGAGKSAGTKKKVMSKSKSTDTNVSKIEPHKLAKSMDPALVLMHTEGHHRLSGMATMEADSDESDWEEVADNIDDEVPETNKSQLPSDPVQFTIDGPNLMQKKRKKFDMEAWFRRNLNRVEREIQINMHKAHLLCLLAHGFYRSNICDDLLLQALALSRVPREMCEVPVRLRDVIYITRFHKWFRETIHIEPNLQKAPINIHTTLLNRLRRKMVASEEEMIYVFVIFLRCLGFDVRLVFSLQPVSHKLTSKVKKVPETVTIESGSNNTSRACSPTSICTIDSIPSTSKNSVSVDLAVKDIKTEQKIHLKGSSKNTAKSTAKLKKEIKKESETKTKELSETKTKRKTSKSTTKQVQVKSESGIKRESRQCRRKSATIIELSGDSEEEPEEKPTASKKSKLNKKADKTKIKHSTSSEEEFDPVEMRLAKSPPVRGGSHKRSVLSSDSDGDISITKSKVTEQGRDHWLEVYLGNEQKWFCIDCISGHINKPKHMESRATQPIRYVLAFHKVCVKDVTQRYASNWMSSTRKQRVDETWWKETLVPYNTWDTKGDEREDLLLQSQQLQKPLPTSIGAFKNHPLYALKRHLLKFEAIYPEESVPVGFIRGEAVYARECVVTLHTRETWLKEGRAVRIGEKPYKTVKARKRRRARPEENEADTVAECFGRWQTEKYMPPPVWEGKVPRNEYGNIEVFQSWMVPPGAVHLRLPGLNRIARKLDVDCVPAMTGWDFHGGWNHPVLDGFVVCEEHKDILIAAWDEEQEIQREREAEKREKRVLSHWKLLVKGLLIKQRLKARFNLYPAGNPHEKKKTVESTPTPGEKATDVAQSWPRNLQKECVPSTSKDCSTSFPFEQI